MTAAPDVTFVVAYLAASGGPSFDEDAVSAALAAETAAQAKACRIPQSLSDPEDPVSDLVDHYPPDLAEALCRRVASNLANRNLPLGVQVSVSEAGGSATRVGGLDREVNRLEAPYRKVLFG
jgi:hypothetical protein